MNEIHTRARKHCGHKVRIYFQFFSHCPTTDPQIPHLGRSNEAATAKVGRFKVAVEENVRRGRCSKLFIGVERAVTNEMKMVRWLRWSRASVSPMPWRLLPRHHACCRQRVGLPSAVCRSLVTKSQSLPLRTARTSAAASTERAAAIVRGRGR